MEAVLRYNKTLCTEPIFSLSHSLLADCFLVLLLNFVAPSTTFGRFQSKLERDEMTDDVRPVMSESQRFQRGGHARGRLSQSHSEVMYVCPLYLASTPCY